MAETALDLYEKKKRDLSSLHKRMDFDRDLLYLKDYQMKDADGQVVPDAHHVTLPTPAIFFDQIKGVLTSAQRQVVVEGKDMDDKQTTKIENFLDDIDYEIDEYLTTQVMPYIDTIQWERVNLRGYVAEMILLEEQDGKLIPDCQPVDVRNLAWEVDREGLTWAGYKVRKSGSSLARDLGKPELSALDKTDVLDFWSREVHEIWVDEKKVVEEENPYGYVPMVIEMVPAGSMLDDKDGFQHRGESVFWLIRKMFAEENRFATISATLTERSFNNHMQYASKEGPNAVPPEAPDLKGSTIYPVDMGGGFKPMPITDVYNASRLWWAIIHDLIQKGSLSDINYGNLTFPLSAVAIENLQESKDKLLVPRLQCYSLYKRRKARMIINQYQRIGKALPLGRDGFKIIYQPSDLDGDYSISYRFFSVSKEQQMADAQIAASMGDDVSEDYKRRHIYKLQNPNEEARKVNLQRAEAADPVLMLYKQAHDMVEEGNEIQAKIIATNAVAILKQRIMGQMSVLEPKPPETDKGRRAVEKLSAMDKGGGSGGRREPGVLEQTAKEFYRMRPE